MNVLITGSAGFIGGHLVRRLAQDGHEVTGLDRRPTAAVPGARMLQVDLLDAGATRRALAEVAPEVVFHLAARTDLNETEHLSGYRDNIDGVESLVSALAATPSVRRWICTSSQLVCRVGYVPRDDADYAPSTLYGESKVCTERIVRASDLERVPWTIVRPTTIWGPGMNPHYLRFFGLIRDGRYFHVGRGPTRKSYGYVGNTVAQYRALMAAPLDTVRGRTFYLADYEPLALEAWADGFRRALGAPPIRTVPRALAVLTARVGDLIARVRPGFPFTSFRLNNVLTEYQAELGPTREVCGELPYTVDQGILATVAWLRSVWTSPPGVVR
ncbi:MAG: NAD(P)-dependent oxidoreductase [Gemmatimonadetes bacterium]|nr:NAD(P)-dependent oxidoreductase [Gemmatimonadota bacterium]